MIGQVVMVVDDEPDIRRVIQEVLEDENYSVVTADNADQARELAANTALDLVLLDIWMPGTDGISLLKEWANDGGPSVPVIMISGHGNVETAVEAVRCGAYDFLEKPLSTGKLLVTVERALQNERLRKENLRLRNRLEPVAELIGRSAAMQKLREQISRVARTDSWVLISGEPGGGKGVVARCIHKESPRRSGQLVELRLAAIPAQNVAVELFGSEENGHIRPGRFEQAKSGTLVLDGIADAELEIQGKLVNALEQARFVRIGGRQPVDFDVRIIATTNRNLARLVGEGKFREDLYYRLNVLPIHVPPLREHLEDVPDLVEYYRDWFVNKEQLPFRKFSTAAINTLRHYHWPGNVRELKNLVQRMLVLNRDEDVSAEEIAANVGTRERPSQLYMESVFDLPLREARDQFERSYLEHHLRRVNGNVAELAASVGLERTHLYRKLKGLGIDPKSLKSA